MDESFDLDQLIIDFEPAGGGFIHNLLRLIGILSSIFLLLMMLDCTCGPRHHCSSDCNAGYTSSY
jgi:hypothetical protein